MEVDFDKQIDTILRDLAKGTTLAETLPKLHLDADELSAFAENALPVKARLRATEHLADCPRCRKILTNTISLTFEAESETIHEEVQTVVTIPPVPWYRQLFAFPQLAYVMGALVLTFSGMVGYLVLQNAKQYSEPTVAHQMDKPTERPVGPTGASSEGQTIETYSSNSPNTVSSANTAANVAIPAANVSANSNAPASPNDTLADKPNAPQPTPAMEPENVPVTEGPATTGKLAETSDSKNKDVAKEETVSKKGDDAPSAKVANEQKVADDNYISRQQQEVVVQNRNQSNIMTPDGAGQNRNMPPATTTKSSPRRDEDDSQQKGGETRAEREKAKKQMSEKRAEPTMTIGAKTFRNLNGIWTDDAYRNGSTINIKRGTKEYEKLDSGLRNIGNSFNGTVIVVWNRKNYKIQ